MLRVITANLNGIRSAAKKGFFNWFAEQNADILCLQETKVHTAQLEDPIFYPKNYYCDYFDAQKKGYSGVAIFARDRKSVV